MLIILFILNRYYFYNEHDERLAIKPQVGIKKRRLKVQEEGLLDQEEGQA